MILLIILQAVKYGIRVATYAYGGFCFLQRLRDYYSFKTRVRVFLHQVCACQHFINRGSLGFLRRGDLGHISFGNHCLNLKSYGHKLYSRGEDSVGPSSRIRVCIPYDAKLFIWSIGLLVIQSTFFGFNFNALRSKSKASYGIFGLWVKYMKTSKHVFTQVDLKKLRFVHLKIFKQESSFKLIEYETLGFQKHKVNEGLGISKRKEDTSFSGNSKSNEKKFTITGIHSPIRPLLLEQLQQSEDPQSHPHKQETEVSGNNVQYFANHASYPIKNSQGQNFTIPVQLVNFSFKPSATSDTVGGNSKQQQALNGGVEVIPSQAFAVSFASFNGTSFPSNLNFSSMKQNPLVNQSLPDVSRQGYQAKQHGMQQQQPATAIQNKASSTNTGSATKFANNGPVFSQSHNQLKSSNQTSHSKITGRTVGSHANHSSSITSKTPIAKNISQEKGRGVDKSSGSNRIQFESTCENADVEKALYVDFVHRVFSEMKCRTDFREDDFDTLRKYTSIDKNLLIGSSSEDNKHMVAVNEKPALQPKGSMFLDSSLLVCPEKSSDDTQTYLTPSPHSLSITPCVKTEKKRKTQETEEEHASRRSKRASRRSKHARRRTEIRRRITRVT
ncbi:unnamed protein product [Vicia faba]|uniref:Uncharacterized protein n=1 Tax=Vicia faba TaxID=3906 RepID=A0AAV0ZYX3_VICFA|nr:unnamed protein product [Vicia faba]